MWYSSYTSFVSLLTPEFSNMFTLRRLSLTIEKCLNVVTADITSGRVGFLKILLDEMYAGLKEYFETLGWEVTSAQDVGLKAAKDREIVEYARAHGMLLVTQDQKPADLADLVGVKFVLISGAMIAKIADEKIREKYGDLT